MMSGTPNPGASPAAPVRGHREVLGLFHDRERLEAQVEGGLYAGLEQYRVQPEPLTPPVPAPKRRAEEDAPAGGD